MTQQSELQNEFMDIVNNLCLSIIDEVVMVELKQSEKRLENVASSFESKSNSIDCSNKKLEETSKNIQNKFNQLIEIVNSIEKTRMILEQGLNDNRQNIFHDMLKLLAKYTEKSNNFQNEYAQNFKSKLSNLYTLVANFKTEANENHNDTLESIGLIIKEIRIYLENSNNKFSEINTEITTHQHKLEVLDSKVSKFKPIAIVILVFTIINMGLLVNLLLSMR